MAETTLAVEVTPSLLQNRLLSILGRAEGMRFGVYWDGMCLAHVFIS